MNWKFWKRRSRKDLEESVSILSADLATAIVKAEILEKQNETLSDDLRGSRVAVSGLVEDVRRLESTLSHCESKIEEQTKRIAQETLESERAKAELAKTQAQLERAELHLQNQKIKMDELQKQMSATLEWIKETHHLSVPVQTPIRKLLSTLTSKRNSLIAFILLLPSLLFAQFPVNTPYGQAWSQTNVLSLANSNATSKPLTNRHINGVTTFFGLEQGSNAVLFVNGSNIVINGTGTGGGGTDAGGTNSRQFGTLILTNLSGNPIPFTNIIVADTGIALGTNLGITYITNTMNTNAFQPASGNLTNWSLYSTNVISTTASNIAFATEVWTNNGLNIQQVPAASLGITSTVFNVSIGRSNIAVGPNALKSNSGSNNVAIGESAMRFATKSGNVAIGGNTLTNDVTGDNVAVGFQALEQNDNGFQNVAVGSFAMRSNRTSQSSTAVGWGALRDSDFNDNNTALGWATLQKLQTGLDNVAVGRGSMDLQINARSATAVGANSLDKMTGEGNTAIGANAFLNALGSGDSNTVIGFGAGASAVDLSSVISLGANTLKSVSSITNSGAFGANSTVTGNGEFVFGKGVSNYYFGGASILSGIVTATNGFLGLAKSQFAGVTNTTTLDVAGRSTLYGGLAIPAFNSTSNFVWTCTNATTGLGEWRAGVAAAGDAGGTNSRQFGTALLTNLSNNPYTGYTNQVFGGTNISVRTVGGTNFIDTTGNLNNWSQIPTGAMANVVAADFLTNWANAVSNLTSTKQFGTALLTNLSNNPYTGYTNIGFFSITNQAWVEMNGSDTTGAFGDRTKPFRSIQAAVSNTFSEINPPWIINVGVGSFTNGDKALVISNGCWIRGAGMDSTEISANFPLTTNGTAVYVKDNGRIYDLTINQLWTNDLAAPIGSYGSFAINAQGTFTNVYTARCRFLGKSDNLYVAVTAGTCSITNDWCWFDGGGNSWDLVATAGNTNSCYAFNNCIMLTHGPAMLGATTMRLGNLFEGTNVFNHCLMVCDGGASLKTEGMVMHNGISAGTPKGQLEMNDCYLYTSALSGTVTDIVNTVSGVVIVRGPFSTNNCIGPITQANYSPLVNKFGPGAFSQVGITNVSTNGVTLTTNSVLAVQPIIALDFVSGITGYTAFGTAKLGASGIGPTTNANQFGAQVTRTIKEGALLTNIMAWPSNVTGPALIGNAKPGIGTNTFEFRNTNDQPVIFGATNNGITLVASNVNFLGPQTNTSMLNVLGGVTNWAAVETRGNATNAGWLAIAGGFTNINGMLTLGSITNGGRVDTAGGMTNYAAFRVVGTTDHSGTVTNAGRMDSAGGVTNWIQSETKGTLYGSSNILVKAGQSTSNAWVGGLIFWSTDSFTNLNAANTLSNMANVSVPAHTLTNNGDMVRAYWGGVSKSTAANTNNFQIVYGSQTILDTGLQIASNFNFRAWVEITRTGGTAQHAEAGLDWQAGIGGATGLAFARTNVNIEIVQTNGIATTLALRGAARALGAATNNSFRVYFDPASR